MIDFLLSGPFRPFARPVFLNGLKLIQSSMIFKPDTPEVGIIRKLGHPSEYNKFSLDEVEESSLTCPDKTKITIWYKPALKNKPTFLYFQGNTGNFADCGSGVDPSGVILEKGRDYRLAMMHEIVKSGRGLLAVCYRGYGTSTGKPSEAGLHQDASTAYKFLTEDKKINPRDIIIYGDSLGGAVAVKLIADLPENLAPAVLITTGTFASIAHKAHDKYPQIPIEAFKPYLKHPYDSAGNIGLIKNSKIILMHGTEDKTTPPHHAEILLQNARAAGADATLITAKGAGHIDIPPRDILMAALNAYEESKVL